LLHATPRHRIREVNTVRWPDTGGGGRGGANLKLTAKLGSSGPKAPPPPPSDHRLPTGLVAKHHGGLRAGEIRTRESECGLQAGSLESGRCTQILKDQMHTTLRQLCQDHHRKANHSVEAIRPRTSGWPVLRRICPASSESAAEHAPGLAGNCTIHVWLKGDGHT